MCNLSFSLFEQCTSNTWFVQFSYSTYMDAHVTHWFVAYVADKAENSAGSLGRADVGAGVNNWRGSLKNEISNVRFIILVCDTEVQSSTSSKAAAHAFFFLPHYPLVQSNVKFWPLITGCNSLLLAVHLICHFTFILLLKPFDRSEEVELETKALLINVICRAV